MMPHNSFLWMKVLLITALLTMDVPGPYTKRLLEHIGKLHYNM